MSDESFILADLDVDVGVEVDAATATVTGELSQLATFPAFDPGNDGAGDEWMSPEYPVLWLDPLPELDEP